jgi:hypothetical protein
MKRPAVKLTEELSEVKLQTSPENGSWFYIVLLTSNRIKPPFLN